MLTCLRLAAVLAAAVLAGCIEVRDEFTLNPDGSGKVAIRLVMADRIAFKGEALSGTVSGTLSFIEGQPAAPAAGSGPGAGVSNEKADLELAARRSLKQLLEKSKGVEAWADIGCGSTTDGRLYVKGTAYFKDVSKFEPALPCVIGAKWGPRGEGVRVLELAPALPKPEEAKPAQPPLKLSDAEVAQRIQSERDAYRLLRPVLAGILDRLKVEASYRLPGEIMEVDHMIALADNSVNIELDGPAILQGLDRIMADDAALREAVLAGRNVARDGVPLAGGILDKLLDGKVPARAVMTRSIKPLFNFDEEVKAAKEAYPKAVEKLQLDKLREAAGPEAKRGE